MSDLVEVSFFPSEKVVWVRPGVTIVDAGVAAGVEIFTGCARGVCGTDPIRVQSGCEGLEPASDQERGTLERMGLEVGEFRLACSATLRNGPVAVEVGVF